MLYRVAAADGTVSDIEVTTIERIAYYLGISNSDMSSVKAMFVSDKQWPYKVLEIEQTATDDEVKKAYRKMAVKFHPDKVAHLGEEYQEQAKGKFQKVNQAYEELKKIRNIS